MSVNEIDDFLAPLEPAKRDALQALRERILTRLPNAEECISYAIPGFRVDGKVIVGFAAYAKHLSWFPHSGKVLPAIADNPTLAPLLEGYDWNMGTLRFPIDRVLSDELVDALIETRLTQAFP
jgi:uncharacterized protein YdhG (YjbR/CyaY superfamily)